MLRKLTIAVAATAALSAVALAPTTASAKPGFGGGGFHHHHGFGGWGIGFVDVASGIADDGCYAPRRVLTPYGYRVRVVNVCAY